MSDAERRKQQLDEKRKRIDELRKQKEQRKQTDVFTLTNESTQPEQNIASDEVTFTNDTDEFVRSVLNQIKKEEEENIETQEIYENKKSVLSISRHLGIIDIPSKIPERYDREIQVNLSHENDEDERGTKNLSTPMKAPIRNIEKTPNRYNPNDIPDIEDNQGEKKQKYLPISQEKKVSLINTEAFQDFLETSSKIVERAIRQSELYELLIDQRENLNSFESKQKEEKIVKRTLKFYEEKICENRPITSIQWNNRQHELFLVSYGRVQGLDSSREYQSSPVRQKLPYTSLSSSGQPSTDNSEIVLTSLQQAPRAGILVPGEFIKESDGLVCIWSMGLDTRPEFIFTCESSVLCARFNPSDPNTIIGSTYSGQIVLWDKRASYLPVKRLNLPPRESHLNPVYQLEFYGSPNTSDFLSASNDGRICFWNLNNLEKPIPFDLKYKANKKEQDDQKEETKEIPLQFQILPLPISNFAIQPTGEQNPPLLVGALSGQVHARTVSTLLSNKDKKDCELQTFSNSHDGMVTSIKFNPLKIQYFATSSVDYSVKIWKLPDSDSIRSESHFISLNPSTSYNYITDLDWSPSHPGLLATVSSGGELNIWNLTGQIEQPIVENEIISQQCLNKVKWSCDGRFIAVGDLKGEITIHEIDEKVRTCSEDSDEMLKKLFEN